MSVRTEWYGEVEDALKKSGIPDSCIGPAGDDETRVCVLLGQDKNTAPHVSGPAPQLMAAIRNSSSVDELLAECESSPVLEAHRQAQSQ